MQRRIPKIIEGVECWNCATCLSYFPASGFYENKRAWNGIKTACKKCHAEQSRRTQNYENQLRLGREHKARMRLKNPGWQKYKKPEKTEKTICRKRFNKRVESGKIIRPKQCSDCGSEGRIHGHHADYSKPFDVEWLCPLCHGKRHRKQRHST